MWPMGDKQGRINKKSTKIPLSSKIGVYNVRVRVILLYVWLMGLGKSCNIYVNTQEILDIIIMWLTIGQMDEMKNIRLADSYLVTNMYR